jgi:hypothetical protein
VAAIVAHSREGCAVLLDTTGLRSAGWLITMHQSVQGALLAAAEEVARRPLLRNAAAVHHDDVVVVVLQPVQFVRDDNDGAVREPAPAAFGSSKTITGLEHSRRRAMPTSWR